MPQSGYSPIELPTARVSGGDYGSLNTRAET